MSDFGEMINTLIEEQTRFNEETIGNVQPFCQAIITYGSRSLSLTLVRQRRSKLLKL